MKLKTSFNGAPSRRKRCASSNLEFPFNNDRARVAEVLAGKSRKTRDRRVVSMKDSCIRKLGMIIGGVLLLKCTLDYIENAPQSRAPTIPRSSEKWKSA